MQVEIGSIWMTKPEYPKKYLKVVYIDPEWNRIARCTYIPNPEATVQAAPMMFDMDFEELSKAYIPYTEAAQVLYGKND